MVVIINLADSLHLVRILNMDLGVPHMEADPRVRDNIFSKIPRLTCEYIR